jgi:hypothetical protein
VGRRPLLVIAGWLGAAVLALSIGYTATNVIGNDLSSASSTPLTPAEVEERLGAASTTAPSGAGPSTVPSPPTPSSPVPSSPAAPSASAPARKTFATPGGTVVARCTGARVQIVSTSPAQGWALHDQDSGPQDEAEAEFRATDDDHRRVKINVRCASGTPVIATRLEEDDD